MKPETYVYKSTRDCDIHADVYRAGAHSLGRTIVWIHGGALIMGSRTWLPDDKRAMYLDAGYTVVAIDYRVAPETKLPEIVGDVREALAWVRTTGPGRFGIDPDRIGVVGHSAGGYLALMSGNFSPRPCVLVSFYGYGDIVGDWYSKPAPFYAGMPAVSAAEAYRNVRGRENTGTRDGGLFYVYCRQQGLWPKEVGGRDPAAAPDFFGPYCPERQVTHAYPPTLLLHGTADTDVPYALSVQMAHALDAAGVEHDLVTIMDGPHVFDKDLSLPGVGEAMARMMDFLHRHMA
jgi:acetyl esterase/lipase